MLPIPDHRSVIPDQLIQQHLQSIVPTHKSTKSKEIKREHVIDNEHQTEEHKEDSVGHKRRNCSLSAPELREKTNATRNKVLMAPTQIITRSKAVKRKNIL